MIFCFILYPATLLKVVIGHGSFLAVSLGPFMYKIVSSADKDTLMSSFLTCVPLITFSCVIALAKTSHILNRCRKSGQPCLVPDLQRPEN